MTNEPESKHTIVPIIVALLVFQFLVCVLWLALRFVPKAPTP